MIYLDAAATTLQKPDTVRVQGKDGLTEAAPETVQPGQTIVVEPGEKIHLDGTVLEGNAEVDTAALTGESIPVSVAPGMEVLAGSVAIDGALTIRVDKPYGDSAVARVLAALEHAQDSKSHTEKFITRFARIYTPIVCGIALALVLIPPLFFGGDWHEWIYRGLSALVVSCPCAIVISVPLSFFGGLGTCSREGILVKGADHFDGQVNGHLAGTELLSELGKAREIELVHLGVGSRELELAAVTAADAELVDAPVADEVMAAAQHTGVAELRAQIVVPPKVMSKSGSEANRPCCAQMAA